MAITPENYLDLKNLFINEIVGDPFLFLIIAAIVAIVVSIKMRLDYKTTTAVLMLVLVGFGGYIYDQVILSLAILLAAGVGYGAYGNYLNN